MPEEGGRGEVGVGWLRSAVVVVFVVVAGVTAAEAAGVVFAVEEVVAGEFRKVVVVSMAEDEEVSKLELGLGSGAWVEEGSFEPGLKGR